MYCPIILGSDKTTVSVTTGNIEYHPLYLSLGVLTNSYRRAHRNSIILIGFLAIPKCMLLFNFTSVLWFLQDHSGDRKYDNDPAFRGFKRKLFHQSISAILQPLKGAMSVPVVCRCPDGHYRRVIFDLASFIADYPEQVLLTGIVSGWCPK